MILEMRIASAQANPFHPEAPSSLSQQTTGRDGPSEKMKSEQAKIRKNLKKN